MTDEQIEKALKDRAYQISYADGDMSKGLLITPKDKLSQEALAYIERLKEACQSAIQSYMRMETLYKVKCTELECVAEKSKKEIAKEILEELFSAREFESLYDRDTNGYIRLKEIIELAKKYGVEVSND